MSKTVTAGNLVIGEGRPKICIPIMGKTIEELENAARSAVAGCPDLVEWRADFFTDIENKDKRKKLVKESGRFWGRFRCFLQYVPEERAERQTLQQRSI